MCAHVWRRQGHTPDANWRTRWHCRENIKIRAKHVCSEDKYKRLAILIGLEIWLQGWKGWRKKGAWPLGKVGQLPFQSRRWSQSKTMHFTYLYLRFQSLLTGEGRSRRFLINRRIVVAAICCLCLFIFLQILSLTLMKVNEVGWTLIVRFRSACCHRIAFLFEL